MVRALSVPLLGGVRGGFMVPMHARSERGLSMNRSAELQFGTVWHVPIADLEIGAPGARFMVPMQARSELRLPSRTPPGCWPPRQTNTLPDGEGQDGGEILGRTRNV